MAWYNTVSNALIGGGQVAVADSQFSAQRTNTRFGYRGVTEVGGVRNVASGLGGPSDKGDTTFFKPTYIANKHQLEIIYNESWAAAKFVDLPIDDMFIRWRKWMTPDKGIVKAIGDAENEYETQLHLADSMKAGRLFGTGLFVIATNNSGLELPLNINTMKQDDLANIFVYDRYDCSVVERGMNPYKKETFNKPMYYIITDPEIGDMKVHHSRVLRFEGKRSITTRGWSYFYDRDWGVSEIIPAMAPIIQEAGTAAGAAHLVQESSIAVIKTAGFRDVNMGEGDMDDPQAGIIGGNLNDYKSIYRMLFLDVSDEFERIEVNFTGIPELMDTNFQHLAAVASIPATRFLGTPPVGFNATGDSDMANYAIHVQSMQEKLLKYKLVMLDMVLAKTMGIKELPDYEWQSLIDLSEEDRAKNRKTLVESVVMTVEKQLIAREEGRNLLIEKDDLYSNLEPITVNLGEFLDEAKEMEKAEMEGKKNVQGSDGGSKDEGMGGKQKAAGKMDMAKVDA